MAEHHGGDLVLPSVKNHFEVLRCVVKRIGKHLIRGSQTDLSVFHAGARNREANPNLFPVDEDVFHRTAIISKAKLLKVML